MCPPPQLRYTGIIFGQCGSLVIENSLRAWEVPVSIPDRVKRNIYILVVEAPLSNARHYKGQFKHSVDFKSEKKSLFGG